MLTIFATAFTWIKATRWAQYVLAAALAIAAFLWWLDSYGDGRVADAQAEQAAAVAKAKEANDLRAASQAAVDAVTNAQADARNADAIAKAQASDPAGVKRQAGPATRAVLEGLRR